MYLIVKYLLHSDEDIASVFIVGILTISSKDVRISIDDQLGLRLRMLHLHFHIFPPKIPLFLGLQC